MWGPAWGLKPVRRQRGKKNGSRDRKKRNSIFSPHPGTKAVGVLVSWKEVSWPFQGVRGGGSPPHGRMGGRAGGRGCGASLTDPTRGQGEWTWTLGSQDRGGQRWAGRGPVMACWIPRFDS